MPYPSQKSRNFPVKLVPWLVMIQLGTPNRYMMSRKNLTAYSERMLVMGFASIHLVNLSTAMSR